MISPLHRSPPPPPVLIKTRSGQSLLIDVMGDLNFQILRGYIFSELW